MYPLLVLYQNKRENQVEGTYFDTRIGTPTLKRGERTPWGNDKTRETPGGHRVTS